MWQILHASFWKFSKLSNSGISLNWSILTKLQHAIQQLTFLVHSIYDDDHDDEDYFRAAWNASAD